MAKKHELSLEDQTKLIMAIGPLFQALVEVGNKLVDAKIVYDSRFNPKRGKLTIQFYRLEEK